MTASESYRDGVLAAWHGEQRGKAIFDLLAEGTADADFRRKWEVLADLEEATGARLAPLVGDAEPVAAETLGLDATAIGAFARLSRAEALARLMAIVEPAIERFRELLSVAPAADRETMQLLVDHEVAIKEFAERELAGASDTALDPVLAVIARAREPVRS